MLFYVNIYGSYKLSKNSPVFLAHPVVNSDCQDMNLCSSDAVCPVLDDTVNTMHLMPSTDECCAVYQQFSVKYWIFKVMQNIWIIIMYHSTQTLALRSLGLHVILPEVCLLFATSSRHVCQKVTEFSA